MSSSTASDFTISINSRQQSAELIQQPQHQPQPQQQPQQPQQQQFSMLQILDMIYALNSTYSAKPTSMLPPDHTKPLINISGLAAPPPTFKHRNYRNTSTSAAAAAPASVKVSSTHRYQELPRTTITQPIIPWKNLSIDQKTTAIQSYYQIRDQTADLTADRLDKLLRPSSDRIIRYNPFTHTIEQIL